MSFRVHLNSSNKVISLPQTYIETLELLEFNMKTNLMQYFNFTILSYHFLYGTQTQLNSSQPKLMNLSFGLSGVIHDAMWDSRTGME